MIGQDAAGEVGSIPALQGVYYRSASDWVALPFTILSPYPTTSWKWWLGVGSRGFVAEVPGDHAALNVSSSPVFVVRGLPSRITPLLIRFDPKNEFRSVKMPYGRLHEPRSSFAEEARVPIDVRLVGEKMVALRPLQALAPGEYAVVASPNANATMEFFSYDFRVAP